MMNIVKFKNECVGCVYWCVWFRIGEGGVINDEHNPQFKKKEELSMMNITHISRKKNSERRPLACFIICVSSVFKT